MQTEVIHMTDQSDLWQREIESLSKENSAAILSVVLGITRGEAADRLLEIEPKISSSPVYASSPKLSAFIA